MSNRYFLTPLPIFFSQQSIEDVLDRSNPWRCSLHLLPRVAPHHFIIFWSPEHHGNAVYINHTKPALPSSTTRRPSIASVNVFRLVHVCSVALIFIQQPCGLVTSNLPIQLNIMRSNPTSARPIFFLFFFLFLAFHLRLSWAAAQQLAPSIRLRRAADNYLPPRPGPSLLSRLWFDYILLILYISFLFNHRSVFDKLYTIGMPLTCRTFYNC